MDFFSTPLDNEYQWLGLVLTTLSFILSIFVLLQTSFLKKQFLEPIQNIFYAKVALKKLN